GEDDETVLRASERLRPALDALVHDGALDGYDMAARYLPSAALQRARQRALPDAATLQAALDAALADSPFRADVFGGFIDDVAKARALPPLTRADLAGTPLAAGVGGLLVGGEGRATALVSLTGLHDPAAVARAARLGGAQLLDMKAASESLVVAYRDRVLAALAVAAVLLALTVWIAMRMSVLVHRRAAHVAIEADDDDDADVDVDAASSPRTGVTRETARRTARVLLP